MTIVKNWYITHNKELRGDIETDRGYVFFSRPIKKLERDYDGDLIVNEEFVLEKENVDSYFDHGKPGRDMRDRIEKWLS